MEAVRTDGNWHLAFPISMREVEDEGITLDVTIKEPGPGGMRLLSVPLDMSFAEALGDGAEEAPEAYERLILDCMQGDATLYSRGDALEAAWDFVDPILTKYNKLGEAVPYAIRNDLIDQIASIKKVFPDFKSYEGATVKRCFQKINWIIPLYRRQHI